MSERRTCRRCRESLPIEQFAAMPFGQPGRIHVCRTCRGKRGSEVRAVQEERLYDGWRTDPPVESMDRFRARVKARLLAARGGRA